MSPDSEPHSMGGHRVERRYCASTMPLQGYPLAEILPALAEFAPDILLISAGFDAHLSDPLGGLRVTTEDFAWLTGELAALAEKSCAGRLVSALEGGYDLAALADSAAAHVRVLMDA